MGEASREIGGVGMSEGGGGRWVRMQDISADIYLLRLLPSTPFDTHVRDPHEREPGKRGDETRKQCSAIKKHSERCEKGIAN